MGQNKDIAVSKRANDQALKGLSTSVSWKKQDVFKFTVENDNIFIHDCLFIEFKGNF